VSSRKVYRTLRVPLRADLIADSSRRLFYFPRKELSFLHEKERKRKTICWSSLLLIFSLTTTRRRYEGDALSNAEN